MKHVRALVIKAVLIIAITAVVLVPAGATFGEAAMIGVVTTVLLYLLGDLLILPTLGNLPATIGDAGVAFLTTWLAPLYTTLARVSPISALLVAVLVGAEEYFLHGYLRRTVLPGPATD